MVATDGLFGQINTFPDPRAQERFAALVGVDHIKERLVTEASLLMDPGYVEKWSNKHYRTLTRAAAEVAKRTPLLVLAGDVGTGKTEVAETFGDAVARRMKVDITLYPLSLSARGKGAVGEMTSLIAQAFSEVAAVASKAHDSGGRIRHGVILLIDEADALAQSRELAQMHHEDRAGVNSLIRGISRLADERLPVLTVLCTNRPDALDPAIVRRAATILEFTRPDDEQRRQLLIGLLEGSGIGTEDIDELVSLTGARDDQPFGCTYSDIRQRLVPEAVLAAASADQPLSGADLLARAETFRATRPFGDGE